MALIKCSECGNEISNRATICPYCGVPLTEPPILSKYVCLKCGEQLPKNVLTCPKCGERVPNDKNLDRDMLYCPECEGLNEIGSFTCVHCGRKYKAAELLSCIIKENNSDEKQPPKKATEKIEKKDDNQAHCPRCGSTSLSANKKGFGVGRATVGTLAFGLVPGLLIGGAGSKKIEVTCLKCGKKFKV